jgi:uncharacterized protein YecE (DUF72 family)
MQAGPIYVGVGGWDYDPWRETFYPPKLPKARQLEHLAGALTATEINATHYKLQKPETFARWAKSVPDGFKFAVKASRFCTNRKALCEGAEGVAKFCGQGLTELGDRLGPILWQFMGTKKFEPDDFRGFLQLLPRSQDGVPLRHVVEPRHDSFKTAEFVALARAAGVGIVFAEADSYPMIADGSGDLVYARLQRAAADEPIGYPDAEIDRWAETARSWSRGESPSGLPTLAEPLPVTPRETYIFFISGAKERNPLAARALIDRL